MRLKIDTMTIPRNLDVPGYLARLGLDRRPEPTVDTLFALQRAHVERVAYENIEIHLERLTTVDPLESAARIVGGRGGYCFHLNGAFSALLGELGFDVTRHLGEVRGAVADAANSPDLKVNHMVLTVRIGEEAWFVDTGLGDALHEPIPLRAGENKQGPFTYGFAPWTAVDDGWRFVHDPAAQSYTSMVFTADPVRIKAFALAHKHLSTSPESSFVKALSVGRRDADGFDVLRGRVLTRNDGTGTQARTLESPTDWFACLAEVFDLPLHDVDAEARQKLWLRVSAAHEAWLVSEAENAAAAAAGAPT